VAAEQRTVASCEPRWEVAVERIGTAQDMDANSFASYVGVNVPAVPATSGVLGIASVAITSGAAMDSLAAGETFRIAVARRVSDTTNDTATGDAELRCVEVKET
jgi:hypothetical protein